ncbi:unnamed protein product [Bursaphelenchus xylophilus]|uniref:(pine wood nematode) hypothetical protein n=1 Tax=Bursaphelenchus xylophilus TaxID=6326 RepID=A0A1I7S6W7_BURXY|nr:unnamed protein product [Bursaphelenchus xylophilus]CAG9079667.1 unnamed protein product [Bursaphelenchus xylophilus]
MFTLAVMAMSSTNSMKVYHYYLVSTIIWSYLCDVTFSAMGMLSLQPLPCLAFQGVLGQFIHSRPLIFSSAAMLIGCGRCAALILQCCYRIFQPSPPQMMFYQFFSKILNDHFVYTSYILMFVLYAVIWGPMWLWFPDQKLQKQLLLEADPNIVQIYDRLPNIVCISYGTSFGTAIWTPLGFVIAVPTIVLWLVYKVYKQIQSGNAPERTVHLHMMLLKSLVAQLVVLGVFLCLPAYILLLLPSAGVRGAPTISICCIIVYFMETNVECLMLVWFVKPYRECCLQIWRYGMGPKGRSVIQVQSGTSLN